MQRARIRGVRSDGVRSSRGAPIVFCTFAHRPARFTTSLPIPQRLRISQGAVHGSPMDWMAISRSFCADPASGPVCPAPSIPPSRHASRARLRRGIRRDAEGQRHGPIGSHHE